MRQGKIFSEGKTAMRTSNMSGESKDMCPLKYIKGNMLYKTEKLGNSSW